MPSLNVREAPGRGRGLYADEFIFPGVKILDFEGDELRADEVPYPCPPEKDHYLQVDVDRYLGPSGGPDDLVNHACDPNAYVLPRGRGARLVATRLIRPDEEVTFDYALTSTDPPERWALDCRCTSDGCRGRVVSFPHLPEGEQIKLARLRVVPVYVLLAAIEAAKLTTR